MSLFWIRIIFSALAGISAGISHEQFINNKIETAFIFRFLSGIFLGFALATIYIEVFIL